MKYLKPIGSAINGCVCGALTFVVLSGCGGGEEDTGGTPKTTVSNTNISLAASTLNINEGGMTERKTDNIKLRLSQTHSTNIVVNYVTIDDTAIGGRDYEPKNGSVTFSPGEREKNIQVTVIGNNNNDEDKRFNVALTLATDDNAKLINENAAIVIKDDDPEPKVSLELDRLDVREGVGSVDIVAKLDRGSYQTVTATLAFAGLASKANDYNVVSSEIVFAPYDTTAHTTITIFEDDIIEGTETIDIAFERLSNGSEGLANTLKVLILGDLRLTDSGVISYYNNGRFDALVPDGCYQQCKTDPLPQLKSDPVVTHWYLFKGCHDFKRRTYENTDFASARTFTTSNS